MKDEIKLTTEEFFKKLGFNGVSISVLLKEGSYYINAMSSEGRLLIGRSGAGLAALEKVLHSVFKHKFGGPVKFWMDINGYRESHDKYLKNIAQEAVKKALVSNQPVSLPAMSAKDRRFVHSELSIRPDVVTESKGEDPDRYIIVYPRP